MRYDRHGTRLQPAGELGHGLDGAALCSLVHPRNHRLVVDPLRLQV
jgi:hypothetical protein